MTRLCSMSDKPTAMPFSTLTVKGASAGDTLSFVGFGTAGDGATFTQIGATNEWVIHSGLDAHDEIITFMNGASPDTSDWHFV